MPGFDKKQIILNALSDGKFHSGEALGQLIGISRAAVSKHIKQYIQTIFGSQHFGITLILRPRLK